MSRGKNGPHLCTVTLAQPLRKWKTPHQPLPTEDLKTTFDSRRHQERAGKHFLPAETWSQLHEGLPREVRQIGQRPVQTTDHFLLSCKGFREERRTIGKELGKDDLALPLLLQTKGIAATLCLPENTKVATRK